MVFIFHPLQFPTLSLLKTSELAYNFHQSPKSISEVYSKTNLNFNVKYLSVVIGKVKFKHLHGRFSRSLTCTENYSRYVYICKRFCTQNQHCRCDWQTKQKGNERLVFCDWLETASSLIYWLENCELVNGFEPFPTFIRPSEQWNGIKFLWHGIGRKASFFLFLFKSNLLWYLK